MSKDEKITRGLVIAVLIIQIFSFFSGCGVKGKVKDISTEVENVKVIQTETKRKIDSLSTVERNLMITEEEMVELIEETPAWKTLRIEEISDKEKISINALQEKE